MRNSYLLVFLMLPIAAIAQDIAEFLPELDYYSICHVDLEKIRVLKADAEPAMKAYLENWIPEYYAQAYEQPLDHLKCCSDSITFISTMADSKFRYFKVVKQQNRLKKENPGASSLYSFFFKKEDSLYLGIFEDFTDDILIIQLKPEQNRLAGLLGQDVLKDLKSGRVVDNNWGKLRYFLTLLDDRFLLISQEEIILSVVTEKWNIEASSFYGTMIYKLISDFVPANAYRWSFRNHKHCREFQLRMMPMNNLSLPESRGAVQEALNSFEEFSITSTTFGDESVNNDVLEIYPNDEAAKEQFDQKRHNPGKKTSVKIGPDGNRIITPLKKQNRDELKGNRIIKYRSKNIEEIEEEYRLLKMFMEKRKNQES